MVKQSLSPGNKPDPGGYILDNRCFPMNAALVPMIFAFSAVAQIAAAQTGNAPQRNADCRKPAALSGDLFL